jgi:hypothetical protein
MLDAFPGDALHWMVQAFLVADARPALAWESIRRARELVPEEPAYEMAALLVALSQDPKTRRDYVARAHETLVSATHQEAAVCFGMAVAASVIAREDRETPFWRFARDAATLGERLVAPGTLEANVFRFLALAAEEGMAGRPAEPELLYRAGLPVGLLDRDPLEEFRKHGQRLVPRFYVAAA